MKIISVTILLVVLLSFSLFVKAQDYSEQYRPQFHFSPKNGWIGDPDGTIKFNNLYHLFWWGHAVSKDLVYWTEYPWPMQGGNTSFDYYTGSVVVDTANTAGFGTGDDTVAVAIY
ncbi:MAG: levanase, partial [Draconibacterium sp.]